VVVVELDPLGWARLVVLALLWIALLAALAGVALARLGRSRAGLAIGTGFALWAAQIVMTGALDVLIPWAPVSPVLLRVVQALLGLLLSACALALIGVGILALPASLKARSRCP
jgi:hypothetical protein